MLGELSCDDCQSLPCEWTQSIVNTKFTMEKNSQVLVNLVTMNLRDAMPHWDDRMHACTRQIQIDSRLSLAAHVSRFPGPRLTSRIPPPRWLDRCLLAFQLRSIWSDNFLPWPLCVIVVDTSHVRLCKILLRGKVLLSRSLDSGTFISPLSHIWSWFSRIYLNLNSISSPRTDVACRFCHLSEQTNEDSPMPSENLRGNRGAAAGAQHTYLRKTAKGKGIRDICFFAGCNSVN